MNLTILGFITLDVSSFGISGTLNIEVLVLTFFEGSDVFSFNLEQLPPSGVLCGCGSDIWMSTISMNFHDVVGPVNVEDSL
jgi:hypothetical protein